MKSNHLSTVALLAFFAGGCANVPSVGPDYHKPETRDGQPQLAQATTAK